MTNQELKKYLEEVKNRVDTAPKNAASQRKLAKLKYSFSEQPPLEQLIVWDYIWNNSMDFWICMQSFLYLESKIKDKEFLIDSWEIIKHWQEKVDNWGKCDALSKIYTKILELIPEKVLGQLKLWNKSRNLWDRRQSIVSLLYFSKTKKVVLPFHTIIALINDVIDDQEHYVQKAVGWGLKELYNVYPAETLLFLEREIKNISSIAFTIATEKIEKKDKNRLKEIRTGARCCTS